MSPFFDEEYMASPKFGIYSWTNIKTGRVLVGQTGSTVGFKKRKNRYLIELRAGRWENTHFQRSWDKRGTDAFRFDKFSFGKEV